jgi:probable nitrogen fixation protein
MAGVMGRAIEHDSTVRTALLVADDDPILASALMQEMLRQTRALDTYGTYDKLSAAEILDPFVLTKERKREIPVIADPDEEVVARVKAYFNAIATLIEQQSGLMAVPLVHLHYEGFGRALITVGRLVVMDRNLRDVHRFGFRSLATMQTEANAVVNRALALIREYPDVAGL